MSGIVLSASVRQNLLSLQSTADLLATTQSRLSTGKKVNTALDNPTNYFTAQGLDNRASDISNLLDGIGNGVQVLQAANTGITSLQKLVDTAKSIATQALQATSGYSARSTATSAAITGATADNLLPPNTAATVTGATAGTLASGAALTGATGGGFVAGDTFTVNGKTITIAAGGTTETAATKTDAVTGNITVNLTYTATPTAATTTDLLGAINAITGGTSSIASNKLTISNATADHTNSIVLGGTALSKLGLAAGTSAPTSTLATTPQTLHVDAIGSNAAQDIQIGGTGGVSTLAGLNAKLAASNLSASIDSTGKLTFTTANDDGSVDLTGKLSGSATGSSGLFGVMSFAAPVADLNAQNTRASLVTQYNAVIDQIKTTAQDASFNGINLLNGDQLKLVFNETGKSTLNIAGVTDDPAGLGLASLAVGTDFLDNDGTNKVLSALNAASSTLRTQASTLGSNLSIVQIRQDFSKNLINVLQTGSSNLTLADTNEEAANSQALSTRQSIAVSALALANQSQQSVLKLLQ
jgi:flagellin